MGTHPQRLPDVPERLQVASGLPEKQRDYTKALDAYKKKHHLTTAAPVRNKAGKVTATPPAKPAGTAPTIPADCPAPSAAAGTGTAP